MTDALRDEDRIRKVLLVDDEPDIRTIGGLSLQGVGKWEVLLASSGPEAVAAAVAGQPDVILLDVMMPGMDGLSTLEALRALEATRAIPVIVVTAKVQRPELDRYGAWGVAGVIAKPFDAMRLPAEIRRLVGEAAARPT